MMQAIIPMPHILGNPTAKARIAITLTSPAPSPFVTRDTPSRTMKIKREKKQESKHSKEQMTEAKKPTNTLFDILIVSRS